MSLKLLREAGRIFLTEQRIPRKMRGCMQYCNRNYLKLIFRKYDCHFCEWHVFIRQFIWLFTLNFSVLGILLSRIPFLTTLLNRVMVFGSAVHSGYRYLEHRLHFCWGFNREATISWKKCCPSIGFDDRSARHSFFRYHIPGMLCYVVVAFESFTNENFCFSKD